MWIVALVPVVIAVLLFAGTLRDRGTAKAAPLVHPHASPGAAGASQVSHTAKAALLVHPYALVARARVAPVALVPKRRG